MARWHAVFWILAHMFPSHFPDHRQWRQIIFLLGLLHLSTCALAGFFENNKLLYLYIVQHFEQTENYMISGQYLNFLAFITHVSLWESSAMKNSLDISLFSSIHFSTQCISVWFLVFLPLIFCSQMYVW